MAAWRLVGIAGDRLERDPQELRYFFLDVDDEFSLFELALQASVFSPQSGDLIVVDWLVRRRSGSAPFQASLLLLFAEVVEHGGVDAFPTQDGGVYFSGPDFCRSSRHE